MVLYKNSTNEEKNISIWPRLISSHSRSIHNSRKSHWKYYRGVFILITRISFLTGKKICILEGVWERVFLTLRVSSKCKKKLIWYITEWPSYVSNKEFTFWFSPLPWLILLLLWPFEHTCTDVKAFLSDFILWSNWEQDQTPLA